MWSERMFEASREEARKALGGGGCAADILSIGSVHNGRDALAGGPRELIMGRIGGHIHLRGVTWDEVMWLNSAEDEIAGGLWRSDDLNRRWTLRHNALRRRRNGDPQPDNGAMMRTLGWLDPAPEDCTMRRLRDIDALSAAAMGCARREGTRIASLMPDPGTWLSCDPAGMTAVRAARTWMDGGARLPVSPSRRLLDGQARTRRWAGALHMDGDARTWGSLGGGGARMGAVRGDVAWLMAEARVRAVLGGLAPEPDDADGGRAYVSAMLGMIRSCADDLYAPTPDGFLRQNLLLAAQ